MPKPVTAARVTPSAAGIRHPALDESDQPSDEQPADDRQREPSDDDDHEEEDPLRHARPP
jgi:hypothetical protein